MWIRRAFCFASLALAVAALAASGARSAPPGSARKAIQAAFDRDTVAIHGLDLGEVLSNCAPDFVSIDMDGKRIGYSVMRQRLLALKPRVKAIAYREV